MRLVWDKKGERLYETGVDRVVLYKNRTKGAPWNGVSGITEKPSGAEPTNLYANNAKYVPLMSTEDLNLTIEAFTYPDDFLKCLGKEELAPGVTIGQQDREHFGVAYRTLVGNDEEGNDYAYKIHLVYDCLASPSEKNNTTTNESLEVSPSSWEISTTPVSIDDNTKTAMVTFDAVSLKKAEMVNVLRSIEDALYGTEKTTAWLPTISEIVELVDYHCHLRDSTGDVLMDSAGKPLLSRVLE